MEQTNGHEEQNDTLEINPDIEIKESPIQGAGLFTKVAIKKGDSIWVTRGGKPQESKIYTDAEFQEFMDWCTANGKEWDAVALGNGTHRAAISDRANNPDNYGNHSCDPNMGSGRVALRDIDPGEELTADYRYFSGKDWTMQCTCGAKNCTGIVKGLM